MAPVGDAPAQLAEAKERLDRHEGIAAVAPAKRALELSTAAGDGAGEESAFYVLVQAEIAAKRCRDAMNLAEDMLGKYRASNNKKGEAMALVAKAAVHLADKEPSHAEHLATEARALAQELGSKESEVEALKVLIPAMAVSLPEEAAGIADSNGGLFSEVEGPAGEAAALLLGAEARLGIKDAAESASAAASAKQALSLLEKKGGTKLQQANALQTRAMACVACGLLEDGQKAATRALALFREARDKIGQGVAGCTLANIDVSKKDYDQAAKRAEEAAGIFAKAGDSLKRADALLTAATAYSSRVSARVGNASTKSLEEWCTAALNAGFMADNLFQSLEENLGRAAAKQQLATVFFTREQFQEALGTAQEAKGLYTEASDGRGVAACLFLISQVQLKWQQVLEAGDNLSEAVRLFKESGDMDGSDAAQGLLEGIKPYYDGAKLQKQRQDSSFEFTPEMGRRGHGWKEGVNCGTTLQYFRFIGMRGRPAANMKN